MDLQGQGHQYQQVQNTGILGSCAHTLTTQVSGTLAHVHTPRNQVSYMCARAHTHAAGLGCAGWANTERLMTHSHDEPLPHQVQVDSCDVPASQSGWISHSTPLGSLWQLGSPRGMLGGVQAMPPAASLGLYRWTLSPHPHQIQKLLEEAHWPVFKLFGVCKPRSWKSNNNLILQNKHI